MTANPSGVPIVVENLSKCYLIGHRFSAAARLRDNALREVIRREVSNFARKAADVIRGRQIVEGDEVEQFWALKDVSFEVKQGEVLGIIGRNGAGKSTLLKILSRITEPTKGRILLRGRFASLLEVGTGFHSELTGRENIFLNGAVLGMSQVEIRKRFDEIVTFAEVEKFLDTPVKHYSSGMYVRLAFAVAAHVDPDILVVDEVLAVGDSEFQKKCLGKMDEFSRKQGRTVLFVSHNHAAIRGLCTHGLVLRNGSASPKLDAKSALEHYVSEGQAAPGSYWQRASKSSKSPVHFLCIEVHLEKHQPRHVLKCCALIQVEPGGSHASLVATIADRNVNIMQAVPKSEAFIGGSPGTYRVELSIALPPLIPGPYYLNFWLGRFNVATFDLVQQAVTFEIVESPDSKRSFPYRLEYGSIAPVISEVSVSKIESIHNSL